MKFIVSFAGVLALLATNAFAGVETHGGDAVVCENSGQITTAETFDLFEGKETGGLVPDLGAATESYEQKVERFLTRVEAHDLFRARAYREAFELFKASSAFMNRASIKEIDDSRELIDPRRGCYKIQAAVQRLKPKEFEKKFLIDNVIWSAMDSDSQAMLVLHEIIYLDEIKHGAVTSDGVRLYNAVMSSSNGDTMNQATYVTLVNQNLKPQPLAFRMHGVFVYYERGMVPDQAMLAEAVEMSVPQGKFICPEKTIALFGPKGEILRCLAGKGEDPRVEFRSTEDQELYGDCRFPEFHASRRVKSCHTGSGGRIPVRGMDALFVCQGDVTVTENGVPVSCDRGHFETAVKIQGETVIRTKLAPLNEMKHDPARFTESGMVVSRLALLDPRTYSFKTADGKPISVMTTEAQKCPGHSSCSQTAIVSLNEAGLADYVATEYRAGRTSQIRVHYQAR